MGILYPPLTALYLSIPNMTNVTTLTAATNHNVHLYSTNTSQNAKLHLPAGLSFQVMNTASSITHTHTVNTLSIIFVLDAVLSHNANAIIMPGAPPAMAMIPSRTLSALWLVLLRLAAVTPSRTAPSIFIHIRYMINLSIIYTHLVY